MSSEVRPSPHGKILAATRQGGEGDENPLPEFRVCAYGFWIVYDVRGLAIHNLALGIRDDRAVVVHPIGNRGSLRRRPEVLAQRCEHRRSGRLAGRV